jgi:hypothetical protein
MVGCSGQRGKRSGLVPGIDDGTSHALCAVQIPSLSDCKGQRDERLRLGARVGDCAGQGLGAVQIPSLSDCKGQRDERLRLGARVGDCAGQGLGAVQIPSLSDCKGQRDERLRLGARVGDCASQGLGVDGQPGRAVKVCGLGRCGDQLSEFPGSGLGVGDGTDLASAWSASRDQRSKSPACAAALAS